MHRREYLAGTAALGVAGLAGCLSRGEEDDYDIGMSANEFQPAEFVVEAGDTVRWRNTGSRGHTVTAYENAIPEDAEYWASGGFDSEEAAREGWEDGEGLLYFGEEYERTFEVPGEHWYVCLPHERARESDTAMVGVVVVEG